MTRDNVGNIPQVEADEDVDPDVEIAEAELARVRKKSARQILEDMREGREDD